MSNLDDHGRPEPPLQGDEAAVLHGFLDYQRATLRWKCEGLDAAGLSATTARSTMTLGGLLKHMTYVEDRWFGRAFLGRAPTPPWDTVDWEADRDWEFSSAAADSPDELLTMWRSACERSRDAVAGAPLDQLAVELDSYHGIAPSLRWILTHMIEEYARHNGHADLLREAVDGATGE
jgi:uncharacterized damage-inducible protein DinB